MKAKLGMIVTEATGSLGGHTFQNSKGGFQIRTKPIPRGNPSVSQLTIRSINQQLQAGWQALTPAQQSIWNSWPVTHGVYNAKGDKHPLSGHSLWMKYQFNQLFQGFSILPDPSLFNTSNELITSFQNGPTNLFETFVSSGRVVSSAINTLAVGSFSSLPYFSGTINERYLFNINFDIISGSISFFIIGDYVAYNGYSNNFSPSSGSFYGIFTLTGGYFPLSLGLHCGLPVSLVVNNISLKKLL